MTHITKGVFFLQDAVFDIADVEPVCRKGLTHPNALRRAIAEADSEAAGIAFQIAADQLHWLLRPTRGKRLTALAWAYRSDHREFRRKAKAGLKGAVAFVERDAKRKMEERSAA